MGTITAYRALTAIAPDSIVPTGAEIVPAFETIILTTLLCAARLMPTFDQLLDQLMESKKGLAQGALQRDEFLQPKEREEDAGLQVFSGLQASANL